MTLKMLFFEYRDTERDFFSTNHFDNYDINFYDFSLNEDTIKNLSEKEKNNASIISVFVNSHLSQVVIENFKNLRIIAIRATGYDNINSKSCIEKNISVLNVQNYGAIPVAEFTLGLMISLVRQITNACLNVKNNTYQNENFIGQNLANLTLGVIGTGSIGAAVCKLASAFNMNIVAYDFKPKNELKIKYDVKYTDFESVVKTADIISLHLPYTGNNYHMFSQKEFDLMKKNSYFINVSRGELVDNIALKNTLDKGKLKGVALDVVACETFCPKCERFANNLETTSLSCLNESKLIREITKYQNVIVTPHIAYNSQDAVNYILKTTFSNIQDSINGGNKNRVI